MLNLKNIILLVIVFGIFYFSLYEDFSKKKLKNIKIDNFTTMISKCIDKEDEGNITLDKSNLTRTEKLFYTHNFTNIRVCKKNKVPSIVVNKILRYPIHIILYRYITENDNVEVENYMYIGLFNDGGLYKKDEIKQTYWDGPIVNSLVKSGDDFLPLRNISLDKDGKLLGVTYDGNLFIKDNSSDNSLLRPYEYPWIKSTLIKNNNIKYINYSNNNIYNIITSDGNLQKYDLDNEDDEENIKNIEVKEEGNSLKLNKMFMDYNNYLLFLTEDNKLYKSKKPNDNNLAEIEVMEDYNQTELIDIIYDYDKTLLGLGFSDKQKDEKEDEFKKRFRTSLLKQENVYYLTKFVKVENNPVNLKKVLTKRDIIKFKNNVIIRKDDVVEPLENLYINEKQKDQKEFRNFCRERFGTSKLDLKLENDIKTNKIKLDSLRKTINKLNNDQFYD